VHVPSTDGSAPHSVKNDNMHLTLMLRTGIIGWSLMMWIVGAALAGCSSR
jgi:hypothetical protein